MLATQSRLAKLELDNESTPSPSGNKCLNEAESVEKETNTGRWTRLEHKMFLDALELYGKDWKKVQQHVGTRTTTQARSHAQKYFAKTGRENELLDDEKSQGKQEAPLIEPKCDNHDELEMQSTAQTYSPTKSDESAAIPKKRLKGPFKPGRRPIKCDSNVQQPLGKRIKKLDESQFNNDILCLPQAACAEPEQCSWINQPIAPPQVIGEFLLSEYENDALHRCQMQQPPEVEFGAIDFDLKEQRKLPDSGHEVKRSWIDEWDLDSDPKPCLGGDFSRFFDGNCNN